MRKILVLTILALAAAACSQPAGPGAGAAPGDTTKPASTPTQNATASPTATETTRVSIYYLVSAPTRFWLAPERHVIPKTQAIAEAALEELVHGTAQDPDHSTPFPRAARINSVVIRDRVATVDWSAKALEATSAGSEVEALGIQSVVYTLTEFSSISKVRFTVEGKDRGQASNGRVIEDWWGAVGLSEQPWDRDPAIDVLEPISLWTPVEGATSTGTLRLTGEVSTFEANVGIFLRDASGRVVVQTSTTASEGAPGRGTFSTVVTFAPPGGPQTWTLQVIEDSPKDGSVSFMENRHIRVG